MIERLAQDEVADAIAVCTGATRGLTNLLRFALQMKQHKDLVKSRNIQSHLGDYPFTKNNFLWQGNIYDLSYFWATDCEVLPLKTVYRLPQELQVKVKANLNDLVQKGYLELTPDGHYLQLTEAGKQIAYKPEFIEKAVQSTQSTVLQVQKYLEYQYGVSATAPKAEKTVATASVKTTATTAEKTGQQAAATTTVAVAGKAAAQNGTQAVGQAAVQSGAQAAAKATTQTAVAGASSAGIGAVVSIAAEAAKSGFKSLSNLVIK